MRQRMFASGETITIGSGACICATDDPVAIFRIAMSADCGAGAGAAGGGAATTGAAPVTDTCSCTADADGCGGAAASFFARSRCTSLRASAGASFFASESSALVSTRRSAKAVFGGDAGAAGFAAAVDSAAADGSADGRGAGVGITTARRLVSVRMTAGGAQVRRYQLQYGPDNATSVVSKLTSVTMYG